MLIPNCFGTYIQRFLMAKNSVQLKKVFMTLALTSIPFVLSLFMIASIVKANNANLKANEVVINAANAHVYEEHVSSAAIYCNRKKLKLPVLTSCSTFTNFKFDEMKIENYKYEPRLIVNVIK
jgi:thymidylate synthase